jgi:hypothetical protein
LHSEIQYLSVSRASLPRRIAATVELNLVKCPAAWKPRCSAKVLLDTQQLVVLRDAIGA